MSATRIVVFAKAPQPGRVKTRLIPALGAEGAAALARRMLEEALAQAVRAGVGPVELCMSPGPADPAWSGLAIPDAVIRGDQGEGDLGARMARAARRVIGEGEAVLLTGTDCPDLTADRLRAASARLADHAAVLYPAADGGYVLLGLNRFEASLFNDMPWSTPAVARLTLARMAALGWRVWVGETLRDIDEERDLVWLSGFPRPIQGG